MAECVNFHVFKKTTMNYELRFKENGIPKDITGWTIFFTVKEKIGDVDANAKINHDLTTHQDALNGKTVIELTQIDTDRVGDYHYDICYRDDQGNVGVLYFGRIVFAEKTTKRA